MMGEQLITFLMALYMLFGILFFMFGIQYFSYQLPSLKREYEQQRSTAHGRKPKARF